jgi:hypothetical protein
MNLTAAAASDAADRARQLTSNGAMTEPDRRATGSGIFSPLVSVA